MYLYSEALFPILEEEKELINQNLVLEKSTPKDKEKSDCSSIITFNMVAILSCLFDDMSFSFSTSNSNITLGSFFSCGYCPSLEICKKTSPCPFDYKFVQTCIIVVVYASFSLVKLIREKYMCNIYVSA